MVQRVYFFLFISVAFLQASAQQEEAPETNISIQAIAGLKFDIVRFKVKPGARIKLTLTNNDEMDHNMVITQPGKRESVVNASHALGEKGPKMNYVPSSPDVLWCIRLLTPGQNASIIFQAPDKTGAYPYVCTFPGHGLVMYGVMYVTNAEMPPLETDKNIPPLPEELADDEHHHEKPALHPYHPTPPYLYRLLLPDAGPAAIAVSLPMELSYCWDAGACKLRYAWSGEFLDPADYWNIKAHHYAKILGTIFYRDKTTYPLHIGNSNEAPAVNFLGYRLVNQYPEFHYQVDGVDVFELIKPQAGGHALERIFRIPKTKKPVTFTFHPDDGVQYSATNGVQGSDTFRFTSEEAAHFTIIMTRK